jgi:5-methylcytosine-specific restriction endonuclease McrA
MRPALRRQFQPIALRIIAEGGGSAEIAQIRQAIKARHPDLRWDRRYPLQVLADNGIVKVTGATVSFVENLGFSQIASLLSALDERAVRTRGLRVEDTSWRPDAAEWQALRQKVIKRDGERCSVAGCGRTDELQLDHRWRGSLLAAIGWSPAAINDPINLQLLCPEHHASKTADEERLLAVDDAMSD